ncbi:unnamed protein product, partial [Rotaria sp. Silwood2]
MVAASPQINVHLTDLTVGDETDTTTNHDCLVIAASIEKKNDLRQIISYCLSEWPSKWNIQNDTRHQIFSFADLNKQNITSQQLYLWSAPIDIIENYQLYLNQLSISNETLLGAQLFYNCSLPSFGPLCQYSFDYYESHYRSLAEVIHNFYKHNAYKPTILTCYTHLNCNRGPAPACLDWTEICDGKVDCLDGGLDEQNCWQLEVNDCEDNEYRCTNGQCIPYTFFLDEEAMPDCLDGTDEIRYLYSELYRCSDKEPTFACEDVTCTICDGFTELLPVNIDGLNETDETECEQWLCNNTYTHCDGIWNCFDGADEVDCDQLLTIQCPLHHHLCISPETNQLICVPLQKVNDANIDCIGASDEPKLCRSHDFPHSGISFHCKNDTHLPCLWFARLCDARNDCQHGDDEQFCNTTYSEGFYRICTIEFASARSDLEEFACKRFNERKKQIIVHFSLDRLLNSISHDSKQDAQISLSNSLTNPRIHHFDNYCHRGLILRVLLDREKNLTNMTCLCPPSFYGDKCQYQNQRVSLTMRFQALSDAWRIPFAILVSLIDDSDERIIHSYQQFTYLPMRDCQIKFNAYLLYSTRPKNHSKVYSIHIDVYEKNSMIYRGSLFLPLNFPFLPVHRVTVQLNIPSSHKALKTCSGLRCVHGQCIEYTNTPTITIFCRCSKGWSGKLCTIPYSCTCSSDSICAGISANNRSICVCSLGRFGSRCLLTNPTCQSDQNVTCDNGGQCIPQDEYLQPENKHTCICSKGFTGKRCETPDAKI